MPKKNYKLKAPKPLQAALLRLAIFALLMYAWALIVRSGEAESLLGKVIGLGLLIVGLNIFFILVASAIAYLYRKKRRLALDFIDNLTIGIHKVTGVLFWITSLLVLVDALFIDVVELLTSLTIFAGFIGIIFKEHIVNFINGITIMFTGKFRLGEFVKIGEYKGKIVDLTFMHTELQTDTKDTIYVPNNIIFSKEAINYSRNQVKNILMNITVSKEYYQYYDVLYAKIADAVLEEYVDTIEDKDKVRIRVDSVDKDSITWTIEFITTRYNFILEKNIRSLVARTVAAFITSVADKQTTKKSAK
jgi:small-conductance mechanosensitive channel